jgi:hypothetical protein
MTIEQWLRNAAEDAERRQSTDLIPRLEALAEATRHLRGAAWNREAVPAGPAPPAPASPPRATGLADEDGSAAGP